MYNQYFIEPFFIGEIRSYVFAIPSMSFCLMYPLWAVYVQSGGFGSIQADLWLSLLCLNEVVKDSYLTWNSIVTQILGGPRYETLQPPLGMTEMSVNKIGSPIQTHATQQNSMYLYSVDALISAHELPQMQSLADTAISDGELRR